MESVVVLNHVVKVFDLDKHRRVVAVNNLSLSIRRGEIFALVGPDGAGKTTTIRMMCGVLPPTEGTVEILGLPMKTHRNVIKQKIGYLSQRFSLYGDLTVDENIDFFAEIHRIKAYRQRKEELLQFTRLTPFRDRLAAQLSGGMKQKLALACTLIHTPEVIFLDEPTTGVDPVSRRDFWKILSSLLRTGITIIVSTPYLDEAERCTRVALLNEGTLLECDRPEAIKASFGREVVEVMVDDVRRAVLLLNEVKGEFSAQLFGDRMHVTLPKSKASLDRLEQILTRNKLTVGSLRPIPPSLEDVFISRISS
ncbi:MAG TPA: ABC transporter ATP-binding protein [Bacteroidota bacterium]|nr:ABC transporter ATP-binding protein [Bacteroidota bacterium]